MRSVRDGGALLVRVWVEHGHPEPLRVRLTAVADVDGPEVEVAATASVDEAMTAVRAWLDAYVSARSDRALRDNPWPE